MRNKLERVWHDFTRRLAREPIAGRERPAVADYPELVARARDEWQAARALFEYVSDPDLVDHAIALITATEKKYTYLLRQAKMDGASCDL